MSEEDLLLEIEALKAIYMDDFKELEEQPYHKVQIVLLPNPGGKDNYVGLTLEITFTQGYPNELPLYKVKDTFGIDQSQLKAIDAIIKEKGKESAGMPMIYNLAAGCKEWLDDNNVSLEERKKKKQQKEEEEIEKKRSQGTPVTVQAFNTWASKFYALLDAEKRKAEGEKLKKQTGKQMFENNTALVTSDADFVEEGETDVNIDWSLFKQELENIKQQELLDQELGEDNE